MARDSVRPSRQLSDSECDFIPTDESEDDLEGFNEEARRTTREQNADELSKLQAEGELPLSVLLRLYGVGIEDGKHHDDQASEHGPIMQNRETDSHRDQITSTSYEHCFTAARVIAEEDDVTFKYEHSFTKKERTKALPYFPEPKSNKSHWSHLLEEMRWLSGDFDRERKWRLRSSAKFASGVSRVTKESRRHKIKQDNQKKEQCHKTAKSIAACVTQFWGKVRKVYALRSAITLQNEQKLMLDAQLDTLVKVTESYVQKLGSRLTNCNSAMVNIPSSDDIIRSQQTIRENDDERRILHVPLLKHSLRDYQIEGIAWLRSCFMNNLNVLLADEMGLGKTIQTISLLALLATEFGNWGPHLIVVPTSVMLNWEVEFKKWCPALKVFTYYGSVKERRVKRHGWSRPNSFHVCITSYKIVTQDQNIFRRKNWQYLILDEAHMIKNWRSQRWQVLLNFSTKHRLLITGTPLQNELMELWALMHFLMPELFSSHSEFKDWFASPMTAMVEGTQIVNKTVINRLHSILRPFVLRRLKAEVETSLPTKHEHVVKCQLSRRQRRLYDEYIHSGETLKSLASGNVMSMMNCLMQLRKVCNHPDLFAGRPIRSPFDMPHTCWLSSFILNMLRTVTTNPGARSAKTYHHIVQCRTPEISQRVSSVARMSHSSMCSKVLLFLSNRRQLLSSHDVVSSRFSFGINDELLSDKLYRRLQGLLRDGEALSAATLTVSVEQDKLLDFMFIIPKVRAQAPRSPKYIDADMLEYSGIVHKMLRPIRKSFIRQSMFFPDKRLVQFDCGKLQVLAQLLRQLKKSDHKVLIFTQMTKMLDILETFLNLHGYTYCRLDGSTSAEQRQLLMQRFNSDKKIFAFILSTRSGGFGINLTGADTVIFYDSDWNPAMDQQAQDRCHRIGQTRQVHIYRLISERTIEESILEKATQKRELDNMAIQLGNFNTVSLIPNVAKGAGAFDEQKSMLHDTLVSEKDMQTSQHLDTPANLAESMQCHDNITDTGLLPIEQYALRQYEDDVAENRVCC